MQFCAFFPTTFLEIAVHSSQHELTSEFEGVSDNVSHERLCQVELAMNKFYADRNLVKLHFFLYRKCILKIFCEAQLSISNHLRL